MSKTTNTKTQSLQVCPGTRTLLAVFSEVLPLAGFLNTLLVTGAR